MRGFVAILSFAVADDDDEQPLLSEVKDAQEKRLEDLKKQAELHARCELERKMSLRYRRVKFFGKFVTRRPQVVRYFGPSSFRTIHHRLQSRVSC